MWSAEHSVETSAAPEQIWRLWADVPGWPEWNGDIEEIELIGGFAAGGTIIMTPIGRASSIGWRSRGRALTPSGLRSARRSAATFQRRWPAWSREPRLRRPAR